MRQAFNRKLSTQQIKRRYFYYHCTKGCKKIYAAEKVHAAFDFLLGEIVAKKEVMDLYQQIFKSFFGKTNEERLLEIQNVQAEIDKNKARINKAMQMMLDGEIESFEYKAIKSRFDMANTTLLRERASLELATMLHTECIVANEGQEALK